MTRKEKYELKRTQLVAEMLNQDNPKWKYLVYNGETSKDYLVSSNGDLFSVNMCRCMKPAPGDDRYLATIIRMNGRKLWISIHRAIAETFIGITNGQEVNHIDGNKQNNSVDNLECISHRDNINHAIDTNLRTKGVNRSMYTDDQIHEVCSMLERGYTRKEIHKKLGIGKEAIRRIQKSRAYKRISKHYHFPKCEEERLIARVKEDITSTTIEIDSTDIEEIIVYPWEIK